MIKLGQLLASFFQAILPAIIAAITGYLERRKEKAERSKIDKENVIKYDEAVKSGDPFKRAQALEDLINGKPSDPSSGV